MSWKHSLWMGAGILALLVLGLLIQLPYRDITTPPPEQVRDSGGLEAELSYLSIPITLPVDVIQTFANQEIAEELVNKKENRKYKTRILGIPTTFEGKVHTVVKRRGAVEVRTRGEQLSVSIPLGFRVQVDGKDTFDPDARADGAVTITVNFRLGVDENWQAHLTAEAGYEWDRKPYIHIGPFRARISSLMGKELEGRLDEAILNLRRRVNEDWNLRERATDRWHELHQVRRLSDRLDAWLLVDPVAAYFPPIRYTPEAMIIEFGLASYLSTAVGEVPPPPEPEPLPALNLTPSPQTGFSIQLPVRINYSGLREQLIKEQAGRVVSLEQGQLTIQDLRLYTSENALVLAVRVAASSPHHIFNTRGWVYLVGRPVYDSEKRILYVEDLDFSRQVDNPLIGSASWILQDSLRQRLRSSLQFDLNERIEELRQSANERINRPLGEGFELNGELQNLNLVYLLPQQEELLIVLAAQGQLAISSTLNEIGLMDNKPHPPEIQPKI